MTSRIRNSCLNAGARIFFTRAAKPLLFQKYHYQSNASYLAGLSALFAGAALSVATAKKPPVHCFDEKTLRCSAYKQQWNQIIEDRQWGRAADLYCDMKEKLSRVDHAILLEFILNTLIEKGASDLTPLFKIALENQKTFDAKPYDGHSALFYLFQAMEPAFHDKNKRQCLQDALFSAYTNLSEEDWEKGFQPVFNAFFAFLNERGASSEELLSEALTTPRFFNLGRESRLYHFLIDATNTQEASRQQIFTKLFFDSLNSDDTDNRPYELFALLQALTHGISEPDRLSILHQNLLFSAIDTGKFPIAAKCCMAICHHLLQHTDEGHFMTFYLWTSMMDRYQNTPIGKNLVHHMLPLIHNDSYYCKTLHYTTLPTLLHALWIDIKKRSDPELITRFIQGFETNLCNDIDTDKMPNYSMVIEELIQHELKEKDLRYIPQILNAYPKCRFREVVSEIWNDPKLIKLFTESNCQNSMDFRWDVLKEAAKKGQTEWIQKVASWGAIPYGYERMVQRTAVENGFPLFAAQMEEVFKSSDTAWDDCLQTSGEVANIWNKKCALILETLPDGDSQGAFSETRDKKLFVEKLQKQGLTPIFKHAGSIDDIASVLDTLLAQKNRLPIIVLRGHGTPSSIDLDKHYSLTPRSPEFRAIIQKLPPKTALILEACSSGRTSRYAPRSFAEIISSWNPDISVFAPTQDTKGNLPIVLDNTTRQVRQVKMFSALNYQDVAATFVNGKKVADARSPFRTTSN